jgi:hypothetical protein
MKIITWGFIWGNRRLPKDDGIINVRIGFRKLNLYYGVSLFPSLVCHKNCMSYHLEHLFKIELHWLWFGAAVSFKWENKNVVPLRDLSELF